MRLDPQPGWASSEIELFLLEPSLVGDDYVRWMNDPQINRFLESRFATHTHDSVRAFVAAALANPDTLFLGIRHRELGKHVGNIKLELNRRHGLGEVGILIGERAVHGRGVATGAIELLAAVARVQLGVRKLTAGCYATNKGSERAFVKAGFTVEGVRPAHFLLEGSPEPMVLMGRIL